MLLVIPYGTTVPLYITPIATYGLIGLHLLIYFVLAILGLNAETVLEGAPLLKGLVGSLIHVHWAPLLLNMIVLFILGPSLEQKLGRDRFIFVYMLAGIVSNVLRYLALPAMRTYIGLGAGSSIFALIGAYIVLFPFHDIKFFYFILIFIGLVKAAVFFVGLVYLLLYIYFGFVFNYLGGYIDMVGMVIGGGYAAALFGLKAFVSEETEALELEAIKDAKEVIAHGGEPVIIKAEEEAEEATEAIEAIKAYLEKLIFKQDWPKIKMVYEKQLEQHPQLVLPAGPQFDLARGLEEHGEMSLALRTYERLIETAPDSPVAKRALFRAGKLCSTFLKKYEQGLTYLKEFLITDPLPYERKQCLELIEQLEQRMEGAEPATTPPMAVERPVETEPISPPSAEELDSLLLEKAEPEPVKPAPPPKPPTVEPPPEEPEPAKMDLKMISPRKQKYSLILPYGAKIDFKAITSIVAEYLNATLPEVEKKLVLGKGVLLKDVNYQDAVKIKKRMNKVGQQVELVMQGDEIVFPPPWDVLDIRFLPKHMGLGFAEGREDIIYEKVRLINCGNVTIRPGTSLFQNVLDLFCLEPKCRWRIWENTFNFKAAGLGIDKVGDQSFYILLDQLVKRCPNAIKSPTVKKMLQNKTLSAMEFYSLSEYEHFNQWLILHYFGQQLPT